MKNTLTEQPLMLSSLASTSLSPEQLLAFFSRLTSHLHQGQPISEMLQCVVQQVQSLLGVEQVFIYQLHPESRRTLLAQSNPPIADPQGTQPFFGQDQLEIPIDLPLSSPPLWGLLVIRYSRLHVWQPLEVELLKQVTQYLAIALQQARWQEQVQPGYAPSWSGEPPTAPTRGDPSHSPQHSTQTAALIEQQVQALEQLNQLKEDFLSTISHELRSPLSTVKMAVQMLKASLSTVPLTETTAHQIGRYLQILNDECQREINLVNDLLELARLDGDTPLALRSPVILQEWVPHIAHRFADRIQQQQQTLHITIPPNLPPCSTNLLDLERILTELLQNACKYTPVREAIAITVNLIPNDDWMDCSSQLWITVSNTGVELPAAECERIFDKFYRIPSHDPWKHGGTGLGLALVKKLVERLEGTVEVEGTAGQTTFRVMLPIAIETCRLCT